MDVTFGFIPNKASRFDLAHSEPCTSRWAIAVVSIIVRILEASFLVLAPLKAAAVSHVATRGRQRTAG